MNKVQMCVQFFMHKMQNVKKKIHLNTGCRADKSRKIRALGVLLFVRPLYPYFSSVSGKCPLMPEAWAFFSEAFQINDALLGHPPCSTSSYNMSDSSLALNTAPDGSWAFVHA